MLAASRGYPSTLCKYNACAESTVVRMPGFVRVLMPGLDRISGSYFFEFCRVTYIECSTKRIAEFAEQSIFKDCVHQEIEAGAQHLLKYTLGGLFGFSFHPQSYVNYEGRHKVNFIRQSICCTY